MSGDEARLGYKLFAEYTDGSFSSYRLIWAFKMASVLIDVLLLFSKFVQKVGMLLSLLEFRSELGLGINPWSIGAWFFLRPTTSITCTWEFEL
jgi:hypothetical protein